jgi:hypothetical protein
VVENAGKERKRLIPTPQVERKDEEKKEEETPDFCLPPVGSRVLVRPGAPRCTQVHSSAPRGTPGKMT